MSDNCPICNTVLKVERSLDRYDCYRCGRFVLSDQIEFIFARLHDMNREKDDTEKVAILSHAIRKMQRAAKEGDYWPNISVELIKAIIKNPLPTLDQQLNNMILWFGQNTRPGETTKIEATTHQAIMGAINRDGFGFVLEQLKHESLIEGVLIWNATRCEVEAKLSFNGWGYYRKLERGSIDSRKAFMAMEYGDRELDEIVDKCFKPSVADAGFELYRLDENPKAGLIDDRLRIEIRNSRFLISDLSHENNGAYWEAGYAEGLGKPVIYTCKKENFDKNKSHFDTNHHLTVIWDTNELKNAVEILKATIRATLPEEAKMHDD